MIARLAMVGLAPLAGLALARLAQRFDGAERVSGAWMAAGALVIAIVSVSFAPSSSALSLGLGLGLLALVAIDVTAFRLPDLITLPLAGVGLGLAIRSPASLPERVIGLLVGFTAMVAVNTLYARVRKRQGLGLGDAKLFAAAGAWLGAAALPAVLLLACAGGMAWVAVRVLVVGRRGLHERLPFGLPLCCAFWTVWLWG